MIALILLALLSNGVFSYEFDEKLFREHLRTNEVTKEMIESLEMSNKIESSLMKSIKFEPKRKSNILVTMKNGDTAPVLNSLNFPANATDAERRQGVRNALGAHAAKSQGSTLSFLNSYLSSVKEVESFWINNEIFISQAPTALVNALSRRPEVDGIKADKEVHLIDGTIGRSFETRQKGKNTYGVEIIDAPRAWREGVTGEGVVVCIIDTGVRESHESLRDNYVGANQNGWYDAAPMWWERRSQTPNDGQGHGTHCAGSVLGTGGIGVAPGAKWSACRGLNRFGMGSSSGLVKCLQFCQCPTDPNGRNEDCSKGAKVTSNSWGSNTDEVPKEYEDALSAQRKAGMIPVFAAGNSGSSCETMGSPGASSQVISVAATDNKDDLADFSSRGPTGKGLVKPECAAPGVDVLSAAHDGDSKYVEMSGTSMACPHVAGVVALMVSANQGLDDFDDITEALYETAKKENLGKGDECGGKKDHSWPKNNHFGHGRVSAYDWLK